MVLDSVRGPSGIGASRDQNVASGSVHFLHEQHWGKPSGARGPTVQSHWLSRVSLRILPFSDTHEYGLFSMFTKKFYSISFPGGLFFMIASLPFRKMK